MKNDAGRFNEAIQSSHVAVGWSKADDLADKTKWEEFKSALRTTYPDDYAANERALGNAAGSLWRFIHDVQPGDYAVVPTPDGFLIAEFEGQAFHEPKGIDTDSGWRRKVKWRTDIARPVPRSHASNELQRRMKARQTCIECTDLMDDIRAAQERGKPLVFTDAILDATRDAVAKCLRSAINDNGLEQVVARLAKASGARNALVQAKNSGLPGDVDVIAFYDLRIGNQESTVKVAYQVKQHDGDSITDEWGIQQLIERMNSDESNVVRGCLVTTARDITEQARNLADENGILVLTEKELVEWVWMVGLQAIGVS
jgi:restriction system protein